MKNVQPVIGIWICLLYRMFWAIIWNVFTFGFPCHTLVPSFKELPIYTALLVELRMPVRETYTAAYMQALLYEQRLGESLLLFTRHISEVCVSVCVCVVGRVRTHAWNDVTRALADARREALFPVTGPAFGKPTIRRYFFKRDRQFPPQPRNVRINGLFLWFLGSFFVLCFILLWFSYIP